MGFKALLAFLFAFASAQANAYTQNIGTWTFTWPSNVGTANYVMQTDGAGVGTWSQVNLATAVTGLLPLNHGGTNATITAVNGGAVYSTASALGVTAAGTSGQVLTSSGAGAPTWTTNANGDVVGPASATDNAVARYDGTTGKLIQDSSVLVDDSGNLAAKNVNVSGTGGGPGEFQAVVNATDPPAASGYIGLSASATNTARWNLGTGNITKFSFPSSSNYTYSFPTFSGELIVNPLTTQGDLLVGGPGGLPSSLSAGAITKVLTSNGPGTTPSWEINYSGDVVGPSSSTDNALARFDTTTGKLIQNSSATLDDTGAMSVSSTAPSLTVVDSANPNTRKMVYDPAGGAQLDVFAANAAGQISGFRQQGRASAINGVVARYTAQFNDGTFPCVSNTNCTAIGRMDWQSTTATPVQAGGNFIGSLGETATATGLFPSMIIHQSARNAFWGFASGSQSATAGLDNAALGHKALRSLMSTGSGASGGNRNTAVGSGSLFTGASNTVTGNDLTAIGYQACNTVQSGSNDLCLGSDADVGSSSVTNAAAIGSNAVVNSSNWQVFGDAAVTNWYLGSPDSSPNARYLYGAPASGSNIAGGDLLVGAGQSTGNGVGGMLDLTATPSGSSGSTTNTTATPEIRITPGTSVTGATVAIQAQTAGQTLDILKVKNSASADVITVPASGGLSVLAGASSFTSPAGYPQSARFYVAPHNPGSFNQAAFIGVSAGAAIDAANFVVADARTADHVYPSIAVLSPDENEAGGFGYDGGTSTLFVESASFSGTKGDLAFRTGTAPATERFRINKVGAFGVAGAYGSTGQVLSSNGSAAVPTWITPVLGASGATGSVQFATGGLLTSDNANFFWDDTNDRLGIGTAAPKSQLHLQGPNSTDTPLGDIIMARFWSSPTNTRASAIFDYFDSSSSREMFVVGVSGNTGSFNTPNQISQAKMVVREDGHVGIGTITPTAKLDVIGDADIVQLKVKGSLGQAAEVFAVTDSSSNRMLTVLGNGLVGLGTDTPTAELDVVGDMIVRGGSSNSFATPTLKLNEDPDNGTDGVSLKSPDSLAASYTLTLPPDDGAAGQIPITNGSGVLSFVNRLQNTGTKASPQTVTAVGGITASGYQDEIVYVESDGGAVTITADPAISGCDAGHANFRLMVVGTDATDTLVIPDGNGTLMNGNVTMGLKSLISYVCDGTDWREVSRNGL